MKFLTLLAFGILSLGLATKSKLPLRFGKGDEEKQKFLSIRGGREVSTPLGAIDQEKVLLTGIAVNLYFAVQAILFPQAAEKKYYNITPGSNPLLKEAILLQGLYLLANGLLTYGALKTNSSLAPFLTKYSAAYWGAFTAFYALRIYQKKLPEGAKQGIYISAALALLNALFAF